MLNLLANDYMIHEINPRMIVLARETRGLTQQDLAKKLNLHKANVSRLEKGDTNIHKETLLAISVATCYPPQFFTQDGGSAPANLAYRKRLQVPVRLLTPIEAKMNIIKRHIQFVMRALDKKASLLPRFTVSEKMEPSSIAELVRDQWGLLNGVIEDLTAILEAQGIIISTFDFGTERVDSRTMLTDDKHPIIFVNRLLSGDRLRYSLAYELGHLVMHTFTTVSPERDVSKEANQFAASFLMPENVILNDFEGAITLSLLGELKKQWKVSMISLLYRADDLGLLSPNQKRYLIQQFNQQKIRRREPVELDIPRENLRLLKRLMEDYMTKYEIKCTEMAAVLAIPIGDYHEYYGNKN